MSLFYALLSSWRAFSGVVGGTLLRRLSRRPPDINIGGADDAYMRRWYVIPRNRYLNIYFHQFLRSDDDRALHDHPWWSLSWVLRGGYLEHFYKGEARVQQYRKQGSVTLRSPSAAHRVELLPGGDGRLKETLTLFVTGPRVREWGFHCAKGWVHWTDFTRPGVKGEVGAGCDGPVYVRKQKPE